MAGVKEYISSNLSFFKGWAVYLPFLILVLCNFLDQYYFTYEGAAAMKSYTLSMPVYWIVVGIGTCISAIMSSLIKKHLAVAVILFLKITPHFIQLGQHAPHLFSIIIRLK